MSAFSMYMWRRMNGPYQRTLEAGEIIESRWRQSEIRENTKRDKTPMGLGFFSLTSKRSSSKYIRPTQHYGAVGHIYGPPREWVDVNPESVEDKPYPSGESINMAYACHAISTGTRGDILAANTPANVPLDMKNLQPAPPELEDGGQATIDPLIEVNLGTEEFP